MCGMVEGGRWEVCSVVWLCVMGRIACMFVGWWWGPFGRRRLRWYGGFGSRLVFWRGCRWER